MVRYFDLKIIVLGPILTKGAEPGDPGLDAVTLRAPDGSLIISGKHIHGRCRHAAEEIAELSNCKQLKDWIVPAFGPDSTKDPTQREIDQNGNKKWEPKRAALDFEELRCETAIGRATDARDFRLPKVDLTEAGEDQMLAVFEQAGAHGEQLEFEGKVRIVCTSDADSRVQQAILLRALRWLTNLGGQAGVGYGAIEKVSLTECAPVPSGLASDPLTEKSADRVDLDLTFTEPFCLAEPQLDENIFLCLDYVPGSALAGAIQRALGDVDSTKAAFHNLRKHFDAIRFRHSLPACMQSRTTPAPLWCPGCWLTDATGSGSEARPIPVPLSWVAIMPKGGAKVFDAALVNEPALFTKDGGEYFPNFQTDWKPDIWKSITGCTGWGGVEKETRMYTEIERTTGTAMDNRLYAYQLVRPDRATEDGLREKVPWRGAIDLSQVEDCDRTKVIAELRDLVRQAPLLLGKTDAKCSMTMRAHEDDDDPKPYEMDGATDCWIVMLVTDTLMLDLEKLAGAQQAELEQSYRDAWNEIGRQTLCGMRSSEPKSEACPFEMQHYFAEEKLVGGDYLHHRFHGNQPPYAPYLLTGAGSVFVLNSRPEQRKEVQDVLHKLLHEGLPLPSHRGARWDTCPFVPQNGYGEIVVNHPAQIERLHTKIGIKVEPVKTVACP
jgi:hypothetical protein